MIDPTTKELKFNPRFEQLYAPQVLPHFMRIFHLKQMPSFVFFFNFYTCTIKIFQQNSNFIVSYIFYKNTYL